jgi:hypothetical protein
MKEEVRCLVSLSLLVSLSIGAWNRANADPSAGGVEPELAFGSASLRFAAADGGTSVPARSEAEWRKELKGARRRRGLLIGFGLPMVVGGVLGYSNLNKNKDTLTGTGKAGMTASEVGAGIGALMVIGGLAKSGRISSLEEEGRQKGFIVEGNPSGVKVSYVMLFK